MKRHVRIDTRALGQLVRVVREGRGWSQRDLAAKGAVGNSTLSRLESGLEEPSLSSWIAICRALGLKPGGALDSCLADAIEKGNAK